MLTTLFKKENVAQLFSCEFCKISNNTFFTEHLRTTASERRALNLKENDCFYGNCKSLVGIFNQTWLLHRHFWRFRILVRNTKEPLLKDLRYKTITSQNVSSEPQVRNFFFGRKVMFRFQDIQVFVFLTIPWFTKSVMSWY